jgi:hypothetical protein
MPTDKTEDRDVTNRSGNTPRLLRLKLVINMFTLRSEINHIRVMHKTHTYNKSDIRLSTKKKKQNSRLVTFKSVTQSVCIRTILRHTQSLPFDRLAESYVQVMA